MALVNGIAVDCDIVQDGDPCQSTDVVGLCRTELETKSTELPYSWVCRECFDGCVSAEDPFAELTVPVRLQLRSSPS